jgi:hypothetical protein
MMPSTSETANQREQRMFSELFDRLINALLNRLFDLNPRNAARRMSYLTIMFLLTGLLIILYHYPLNSWMDRIREILWYLLNSTYAASYDGNPFTKFMDLAIQALTDAHVLQYFPILFAPFFIALHLAALYLADIFELEDVAVARSFVWEVALSGSDETIHISQGKIADQHRESPNYLIGGPGKVIVELDSVALFEKADGTPHVIGPTGKEPGGKAVIDGFERFRQAIDIRNHHVDLSVTSRSLDGIPIMATDVRLMFSIDRGDNIQPSAEYPYPFNAKAIERIVYSSTSKVTPDQKNPSTYEFVWTPKMISLIRGRLSVFMSEKNLTEYLASIGIPEFEKLQKRENDIANDVRQLTQPDDESFKAKTLKPPPDFTPRHKVTDLFAQFTEAAHINGVELHWIGVGTWKTALEKDIVSEKHLEAWELSQNNLKSGNPEALNKAEGEAIYKKMEELIKAVPIEAYENLSNDFKPTKKHGKTIPRRKDGGRHRDKILEINKGEFEESFLEVLDYYIEHKDEKEPEPEHIKNLDHNNEMRALLLEYRNQFMETIEFMRAKKEAVPPKLIEAVVYIEKQMGIRWLGGRSLPGMTDR